MKAVPLILHEGAYKKVEPNEATHVMIEIPGPYPTRILPVLIKGSRAGTNCWSWNGSTASPTLKPSILTKAMDIRCHTWVTEGKAKFLADCTHEFVNQTLDLLDVDFDL